jgi:hypothetical protein
MIIHYHQNFLAAYSEGLDKLCVGVQNVDVVDPNCPNCSAFVIVTNVGNPQEQVEFGCNPSINNFDISTTIANNCEVEREVLVEIFYNTNYVEFMDLDDDFVSFPYNGGDFNAVYKLPSFALDKGEGDLNMGHVKVKGSGQIGTQANGTAVNIVFRINPGAKIKNTNQNIGGIVPLTQKNIWFNFTYNHQIDKTNLSIVKASELDHPYVDSGHLPLNFCTNIKYDIYINGIFEIDINQSYCNTNFYFGPNAKIVINPGKTLTLKNSTLTTCDGTEKWQGIELSESSSISLAKKSTITKANIGIFSEYASSNVSIDDLSIISYCNTGIKLVGASLSLLKNSSFSHCNQAIDLNACPIVNADKCTFSFNRLGINAFNTNVISTSDFSGGLPFQGITHNSAGAHELYIPSGKFTNLQVGITSDPYIQAQAYVMHVELALMMGDSIANYTNKLTQIANACPLALGDAVYGARGLLESQTFQDISYNDNILCQSTTQRASLGIFSINNARDIVSIRISNQLGSLGKQILNINNNDVIDLDITTFMNGVYFVEIINNKIILLK